MNVQSCKPNLTIQQLFQDHLQSTTLLSQKAMFWETYTMNEQILFPSVTNGHFKTIYCIQLY